MRPVTFLTGSNAPCQEFRCSVLTMFNRVRGSCLQLLPLRGSSRVALAMSFPWQSSDWRALTEIASACFYTAQPQEWQTRQWRHQMSGIVSSCHLLITIFRDDAFLSRTSEDLAARASSRTRRTVFVFLRSKDTTMMMMHVICAADFLDRR